MTHTTISATRVNEIDLLRFLAALAVVIFHYAFRGFAADAMSLMPYPLLAPIAKYGYLGVELFFMISGFVILMTAANGNLTSFLVSRLVRLYPAFWACCTLTFTLTLIMGGPRFTAFFTQYLINMTMLNGFFGVPSIDGAYWSLFVEMQFYAMVAVMLATKSVARAEQWLWLWLVASIALEIVPIGKLRYLLIVEHSAFFIAGASYFLIWSKGKSLFRLIIIASSLLLAIYQSGQGLAEFERYYHTPMNFWMIVCIITSFFLLFLLIAFKRTGTIGKRRWLLAGVLTYPFYLIHQYVGFMIFNRAFPMINTHLLFWGTILMMLLIAYAVHNGVEKKLAWPMKQTLNKSFAYFSTKARSMT